MRVLFLWAFVVAASGTARGERVHVGLHAQLVWPQIASELGTSVGVELEGGYRLWRRLALQGTIAYSQPVLEAEAQDPRVGAMEFMTTITQRELSFGIGVLAWLRPRPARWNG